MTKINEFEEYLSEILEPSKYGSLILYRGQVVDKPLLPSVVRNNGSQFKPETLDTEIRILNEFKKSSGLYTKSYQLLSDWDWLSLAQHFGVKTRLLDWTTNPLAALWFSLIYLDEKNQDHSPVVYRYVTDYDRLLYISTEKIEELPFEIRSPKTFRPNIIDRRLEAQESYFTAHCYEDEKECYAPFEDHEPQRITKFQINKSLKKEALEKLFLLGTNYLTLFPDLEGIAKHLNWMEENGIRRSYP